MRHIKITAAFLAVLAMSGCEQSAQAETPDAQILRVEIERIGFGYGVTVIHDEKRDVTCWVFDANRSGGISCIPDWMLDRGAVESDSIGIQK